MFKLEITTDNAAFEDDEGSEVARILSALAERLAAGSERGGGLYDLNGNRVGQWSLEPSR